MLKDNLILSNTRMPHNLNCSLSLPWHRQCVEGCEMFASFGGQQSSILLMEREIVVLHIILLLLLTKIYVSYFHFVSMVIGVNIVYHSCVLYHYFVKPTTKNVSSNILKSSGLCTTLKDYNPTIGFHPSVICQGHGEAGDNCTWPWVRGGVHPDLATGLTQRRKQPFTLTAVGNLE